MSLYFGGVDPLRYHDVVEWERAVVAGLNENELYPWRHDPEYVAHEVLRAWSDAFNPPTKRVLRQRRILELFDLEYPTAEDDAELDDLIEHYKKDRRKAKAINRQKEHTRNGHE